jgi:DNA-binding winged helix-turn-helix (wHTH) protein/Tol biopolymer transport system component
LDLDAGFLKRGTEEVSLRPKSFQVLSYLVERHGRLVTKTELTEAVWPDAAITDNSLAQCLVEIRRALDDDAQELIRTVARRGYIFTAQVTRPVAEFPRSAADTPAESGLLLHPQAAKPRKEIYLMLGALAIGVVVTIFLVSVNPPAKKEPAYTKLTNFTDSAVAPALSPDGRMLAFYRSDEWWLTRDPIYVKLLPNGEPIRILDDPRAKYGLTFSPDGSRIAYTVAQSSWDTYTVSPFGGESSRLLSNAAGLTWLDERRILFSEIRAGIHMGVVTALENRSESRRLYFPQDERGMVHFSYPSPDRKWALVVEMDPTWKPCRLIPLDGSSAGWQVGPKGRCTAAAWSPNGKWMYLGVETDGNRHLWRQRFPKEKPERITVGPADEEGLAVAPDGRSLITSIGMQQSAVWVHDSGAEHALSSEGYVPTLIESGLFGTIPKFTQDGTFLFYLRRVSPEGAIELWRTNLENQKSENVVPGFSTLEYDVSTETNEVVFSTQPAGKATQLWIAAIDRRFSPKLISSSGDTSPHFGRDNSIHYRLSDGTTHHLARMNRDGSNRSKVADYPIGNVQTISPDRRWIVAFVPPVDGGLYLTTLAIPTEGGSPKRICVRANCTVNWSPDGKFLYVGVERKSRTSQGKTLVIPVPPGQMFPELPETGIRGLADGSALRGARVLEGWNIAPGPSPSVFAYVKTTVHRNLFRIPLRDD